MTFAQFLFIAVEGFLFEADLGRKPPAIPIRYGTLKSLLAFGPFKKSRGGSRITRIEDILF